MQGHSVVIGWLDRRGESHLGVCHFQGLAGRLQCLCHLSSGLQLRASTGDGLKALLLEISPALEHRRRETEAAQRPRQPRDHPLVLWARSQPCVATRNSVTCPFSHCGRWMRVCGWEAVTSLVVSGSPPSTVPAGLCMVGRPCTRLV